MHAVVAQGSGARDWRCRQARAPLAQPTGPVLLGRFRSCATSCLTAVLWGYWSSRPVKLHGVVAPRWHSALCHVGLSSHRCRMEAITVGVAFSLSGLLQQCGPSILQRASIFLNHFSIVGAPRLQETQLLFCLLSLLFARYAFRCVKHSFCVLQGCAFVFRSLAWRGRHALPPSMVGTLDACYKHRFITHIVAVALCKRSRASESERKPWRREAWRWPFYNVHVTLCSQRC